jgi:ATP-dependent helicase/DNAse subunit B
MSLRIIAGRANTGKSSYIYDEIIRAAEETKDKLLLLVPELMTYQAESEIIQKYDLAGIIKVEVLSFKRLENKVLEEVGGLRLPDMSVFGKIMLLKQIFEENKDKLKIFGSSYRQTGFLKEFGELVAEFKPWKFFIQEIHNIKTFHYQYVHAGICQLFKCQLLRKVFSSNYNIGVVYIGYGKFKIPAPLGSFGGSGYSRQFSF